MNETIFSIILNTQYQLRVIKYIIRTFSTELLLLIHYVKFETNSIYIYIEVARYLLQTYALRKISIQHE